MTKLYQHIARNLRTAQSENQQHVEFHHMNDVGYYDGWTQHTVIITPSLQWGFDMRVTGRDKRGIKEYIAEVFGYILGKDVTL